MKASYFLLCIFPTAENAQGFFVLFLKATFTAVIDVCFPLPPTRSRCFHWEYNEGGDLSKWFLRKETEMEKKDARES